MGFYKKFLIVLLLVLALAGLNRYVFKNFLANGVAALSARPGAWLVSNFTQAATWGRGILNFTDLVRENEALNRQRYELLAQLADYMTLQRQNQALREQLALPARSQPRLLAAKIFSVSRGQLASTILIDQGHADGVGRGMAVIKSGNVLLGSIGEVFERSAVVWLADDPRSIIGVKIGPAAVVANAQGRAGSGQVNLELIANRDPVQPDDLIVTNGLDSLPEALLVGKVTQIELQGGNLFKSAHGELFFEPLTDPDVFVIFP